MATISTGYDQTLITKPVAPTSPGTPMDYKDFSIFVRPLFYNQVILEPEYQQQLSASRSIFRGNEIAHPEVMLNDLAYGQEVRVIIEKNQNPFDLFAKDAMTYGNVDANGCVQELQLDCNMSCLNTLPDFEIMSFRFDTEYTWGVLACDKNKKFWDFNYFARQYNKSRNAKDFGREVDLWNTFVKGIIAAPATTIRADVAKAFPTHYWQNLGSVFANGRNYIPMAVAYMFNAFANLNLYVVMTQEAGRDIIKSVETPYNVNFATQRVNTDAAWDIPGYLVDEQVRNLLGLPSNVPVLLLQNSPWLTYSEAAEGGATRLVSQFPLWSEDGTKQYVAIFDPRVAYQFETEGYHMDIVPYSCTHLQRGMQDSEYVGSGITFAVYGLIMEFDAYKYEVPAANAVGAAEAAVKAALTE